VEARPALSRRRDAGHRKLSGEDELIMNLRIRGPEAIVTAALRAQVETQVGLALGRFADRVGPITVRFSSRNARIRCQIEVALRPRVVHVEEDDDSPSRAANHAIARVDGPVGRAIERALES
jgi:ribosome-associated translation inhibitor RaiA